VSACACDAGCQVGRRGPRLDKGRELLAGLAASLADAAGSSLGAAHRRGHLKLTWLDAGELLDGVATQGTCAGLGALLPWKRILRL
jgi:hypothetical protein